MESSHFRIVAAPRAARAAENALRRLEFIRSALIELHGEDWVSRGILHVWLPESSRAFRKVAQQEYEQGLFQSGPRIDWIVINPDANRIDEVLAHEYLHAVLRYRYPNLPRWIEEGVCDYYSSLAQVSSGKANYLAVGVPPGNRLGVFRSSRSWTTKQLEDKDFPPEAYAWSWAHIHLAARQEKISNILASARTRKWTPPLTSEEFPASRVPGFRQETIGINAMNAAAAQELRQQAAVAFETQGSSALGESIFLEGLRLLDDEKPQEAIKILEEAVRRAPSQSSWWLSLATAYGETGDKMRQREAAQKALHTAVTDTEKRASEALLRALE